GFRRDHPRIKHRAAGGGTELIRKLTLLQIREIGLQRRVGWHGGGVSWSARSGYRVTVQRQNANVAPNADVAGTITRPAWRCTPPTPPLPIAAITASSERVRNSSAAM